MIGPSKTDIGDGIVESSFLESLQTELATVAEPTGSAVRRGVIATPGQTIV
jgi:hypothetical protein